MARPDVRPLPLTGTPTDVLRRLRGAPGLVALVGDWCGGGAVLAWEPAEVRSADGDPFDLPLPPITDAGAARFGCGWVALWGYQLNRLLEAVPPPPPRPDAQADHWCARYDWVIRYDAGQGAWAFETVLEPDQATAARDRALARLASGSPEPRPYAFTTFVMDGGGPEAYRAAVAEARKLIHRGDIFQANICTRLVSRLDGDPLDAFCDGVALLAPAYAAYVDAGERQVVSLSPELFLRREAREVVTRPIKGTAPAGQDPGVLAHSAKDRAENVMIVDLMRNDLGRVCEVGSVRVPRLALAEEGAGVRHLVSEVRGTLPPETTDAELLRATFPPGSVTGAPKVRAMEVIHELEATGRELYTGSIGYLSPVAGLEASVVIRTFEIADGRCWIGVGCGIVADSDPDAEVAEAFTKVDPLLAAVGASRTAYPPAPTLDAAPGHSTPPRPVGSPPDAPDVGKGLLETVLVRDGVAVDLSAHLDRLGDSALGLYGEHVDRAPLEHAVRRAAAGRAGPARLRVTWSPADRRAHVAAHEIDPPRLEPRTLAVAGLTGGLGAHKWTDRRLVDRLRAEAGTDDVLLVDEAGRLLECGTANVFLVLEGEVVTPPTDGRILPGVTRAHVLDLLHRRGVPVAERPVALAELPRAREIFTASSIRGVQPVVAIGGIGVWPAGRTTRWLHGTLARPWSGDVITTPDEPTTRRTDAHVLILDNYDSFTYNLAQRLRGLGAVVDVVRNDHIDVATLETGAGDGSFTHLVISPGPGTPDDAGVSVAAVRALGAHTPVLGVCLGHQCIGQAYGARVVRAPWPVHGQPSLLHHDGRGIYTGLDGPLVAGRYHSLVLADLPRALLATAFSGDGTLMGVRHRSHPVEGTQVHPESILTPQGSRLLQTFLTAPRPSRALTRRTAERISKN
ncbi:chorismate-binding protein [Nocardioides cynanchi]|uniref:chorismate-binding protein n=1 Tax=Nocardioides cynanchi TaxID=2558918 RepID=UPI00177D979B|nr:chorismate-binding protein [Nocardioides cynanchi]